GVVMFELLTGDRPFKGDTAWATMNATMNSDAPDLGRIRTDVPPGLVHIVSRALARKPEHRYASAGDLSIDLKALRASLGAARDAAPVSPSSWRRMAIAGAVVVAIGAIGTFGWMWQRSSRANWVRTVAIPQI